MHARKFGRKRAWLYASTSGDAEVCAYFYVLAVAMVMSLRGRMKKYVLPEPARDYAVLAVREMGRE